MRVTLGVVIGAAFLLAFIGHEPVVAFASGVTITVNTTADNTTGGDGHCTLREAFANVNASTDPTAGDCPAGSGSGDTITFAVPLPAKIKLTSGSLSIMRSVAIAGPPSGSLHLIGHRSRVFTIIAGTVSISDVGIESGHALADGSSPYGGGAIYNATTTTLTNCTLSRNKTDTFDGGAITNNGGTMALVGCTLSRNTAIRRLEGGAIENFAGTMTLTNCTLDRNKAGLNGGAIANAQGASVTLTNCTLALNKAGSFGGAIFNYGAVTIVNSTVSGNIAHCCGGPSSGIFTSGPGGVTLLNTIVAHNFGEGNCVGTIASNGHNLESADTCHLAGATDLTFTDPMLTSLGLYGGALETMALCSGAGMPNRTCRGVSPAIDAGDDAVLGPPDDLTTDERGAPRKTGSHVDIGAYEAP